MGALQTKRSVDITIDAKKVAEGTEGESGELEGRVGKIADGDDQNVVNGVEIEEKDKEQADAEEVVENGTCRAGSGDNPIEEDSVKNNVDELVDNKQVETANEENSQTAASDGTKKNKKDKVKKKWSFRSFSFSKKDKSKPNKDLDKSIEEKEISPEGSSDAIKEEETKSTSEIIEEKSSKAATEINGVDTIDPANKEIEECQPVQTETKAEEPVVAVKVAEVKCEKSSPSENKPSDHIDIPPSVVKSESVQDNVETSVKKVEDASSIIPIAVETVAAIEEKTEKKITETIEVIQEVDVKPVESEEPIMAANDENIECELQEKEIVTVESESTKEVPPPLPASPPPSPLSVLAQSTMAETVPAEILNHDSLEENRPSTPETNAHTIPVMECNLVQDTNMDDTEVIVDLKNNDLVNSAQMEVTITESTTEIVSSVETSKIIENSQHIDNEIISKSQIECEPILEIEMNAMTIGIDKPVILPPSTESVTEIESASDDLPSPPIAASPELVDQPALSDEESLIISQKSDDGSCKKKLDVPILDESIDESMDIIKSQDIMSTGEIVCSNGSN